jgi:hypothetical protein
MKVFKITLASVTLLALETTAFAHARWKLGSALTPPRTNATGLKSAPCGAAPRTALSKNYSPGQVIPVEFEETINHPGRFEIRILGPADQPLAAYTAPLLTIQDVQNTAIQNGVNHQYTGQVPLPNITCIDCSLQLIQVMTENPANPSLYYSCTDISIGATPPEKPSGLKLEKRN